MSDTSKSAREALSGAQTLIDANAHHFAALCVVEGRVVIESLDRHQIALYEFAGLAARLLAAEQLMEAATPTSSGGPVFDLRRELATLYVAETVRDCLRLFAFRESEFRLSSDTLDSLLHTPVIIAFLNERLNSQIYQTIASLIDQTNSAGADVLSDEHDALRATFGRYAADKVAPLAEQIHREDLLLPDSQIEDLAAMGCFGITIPTRYGGLLDEDNPDHTAMVIISEELSRASFPTAGSLITRPELLSKALLKGGTEEQKEKWLPLIASGQCQVAVAVTEPDYGSNVASLRTTARPADGGWRISGTKTWSTFAGRSDTLMVLARTDPDLSKAHRGLSLFIAEKPPAYGHSFEHSGRNGRIEGRAIATLGYRGMHSYEVLFDNYFVPADNLIGGEAGLTYSRQREVFGQSLLAYPLTQHKLARMAMMIQATRQLAYHAARQMDTGAGSVEAAMVKLIAARAAEWITRESQQLHGGMGYAEEFPISRHFIDARVLSIFEGTEEVLALRIIAKALLETAALDGFEAD